VVEWRDDGAGAMLEPVLGGPAPGSSPAPGFSGALALYPGCGMERVQGRYVPYAPVLMLLASADDEVSPVRCQELAARSQAAGGALEVVVYEGAEHGFDDPGARRQGREPNRRATEDAKARAERFFRDRLGR
jgi:carboxymethylenebutenolidase